MTYRYPQMPPEGFTALQRFADVHGRSWRNELAEVYWFNARIWTGGAPEDGPLLHMIRNDFGPTWLYRVCKVKPRRKS